MKNRLKNPNFLYLNFPKWYLMHDPIKQLQNPCKGFKKLILIPILLAFSLIQAIAQPTISYSFIVAGHAYGAHATQSNGLHPNFLASLNAGYDTTVRFMVLTGDIVNYSTEESWQQVEAELAGLNIPAYYVMGNHDANVIGKAVFEDKFGGLYYAFDYGKERFVILNSIEADRAISPNQLIFLKGQLETLPDTVKNVFIFFHEVIWNSHEKYKGVLSNSRSRYDQMVDYSNYWDEVHPLLEQYTNKKIFVMAGDVGGNPDATATFYDQWEHVTLLASGMGEVEDENYLLVSLMTDGSVALKPIPLNVEIVMNNIEYYSVPKQPEFIEFESIVAPQVGYTYTVAEIDNADLYEWSLPEHATGTSTSNSMSAIFDDDFISGEISVSAFHTKFGSSSPVSQGVNSIGTHVEHNSLSKLKIKLLQNSSICCIDIVSQYNDNIHLELIDLKGRLVFTQKFFILSNTEKQIELSMPLKGIYLLSITGNHASYVNKICIR